MYKKLLQDPDLPVDKPTPSYWQNPPHKGLLGVQSAQLPAKRDIVIIGSGITACSVTRQLLKGGHKGTVTLLEAREVCSGATGRNGGRINCVAVQDFDKYSRLYGVEMAKKIVRFELAHLDELTAVAKDLGDEAFKRTEVREVDTIATVFSEKKLAELKELLANFEAALPELTGRWKVVEDQARTVYGIENAAGALIGKAGAVWGYRFITEVFARLLADHGDVFSIETKTPVLKISRNASQSEPYPYQVKTPRGIVLAKHVIHCTEGHVSHLVPGLRGILVPRRGQMTVLNPGQAFKNSKGKRSWSFYYDRGFDYLSQNEKTGELYVGGGDIGGIEGSLDILGTASDAEENLVSKSHLAGVMPVLFGKSGWGHEQPGKRLLQTSWVGVLCNSLDKAPLVGILPQEALGSRAAGSFEAGAEWISAGYGGYGMVNAWLCGKAVALQLLGERAPEWLPEVYVATPERVLRLKRQLTEAQDSLGHLKALL